MRKLLKWVAIALVIAAIAEELRKPREQRTWVGRVANLVPYDFRVPTPEDVPALSLLVATRVWSEGSGRGAPPRRAPPARQLPRPRPAHHPCLLLPLLLRRIAPQGGFQKGAAHRNPRQGWH